MDQNEIIKKYYEKESIIKILTSYILYYQITLGRYIYETIQDKEETIKKIKELNLVLEPNQILIIVSEGILQNANEENFKNDFEKYIRIEAMLHALNDFVKNDNDLLNKDHFLEYKKKDILEDTAFNSGMKMQYLNEYPCMFNHYNNIIDDNYVLSVQEIIYDNFINI